MKPTTAIVIIHYGQIETTRASLKKLTGKITSYPLIMVNNTSQDLTSLKKIIPQIHFIQNRRNLGFAKGVNLGIDYALKNLNPDSILLLNNDLSFSYGTISRLRKTLFYESGAGLVAPVLHHSKELYDWGGKYNRWWGSVKHQNFKQKPKRLIQVDHLAGAALLIKKEVFDQIGFFDERFFLYFEDLDFCLRAKRAGYRLFIDPEVVAEHQVSASSKPLNRILYQWQSHLKFVFKYLPFQVYPTALLYDLIFYPLSILKILLNKLITHE